MFGQSFPCPSARYGAARDKMQVIAVIAVIAYIKHIEHKVGSAVSAHARAAYGNK